MKPNAELRRGSEPSPPTACSAAWHGVQRRLHRSDWAGDEWDHFDQHEKAALRAAIKRGDVVYDPKACQGHCLWLKQYAPNAELSGNQKPGKEVDHV